MTELCVVVK